MQEQLFAAEANDSFLDENGLRLYDSVERHVYLGMGMLPKESRLSIRSDSLGGDFLIDLTIQIARDFAFRLLCPWLTTLYSLLLRSHKWCCNLVRYRDLSG